MTVFRKSRVLDVNFYEHLLKRRHQFPIDYTPSTRYLGSRTHHFHHDPQQ